MSATKTNSITLPRIVYQTPEGRVRVDRDGPRDYSLYLDGQYIKSYEHCFQAEHDGAMWLHDQAEQLAAQIADEQADRDAEAGASAPRVRALTGTRCYEIGEVISTYTHPISKTEMYRVRFADGYEVEAGHLCWQHVHEPIIPSQPTAQPETVITIAQDGLCDTYRVQVNGQIVADVPADLEELLLFRIAVLLVSNRPARYGVHLAG